MNLPGFAQHVATDLCLVDGALPAALDMDGGSNEMPAGSARSTKPWRPSEAGGAVKAVESRSP
jgi:hypothetical protein